MGAAHDTAIFVKDNRQFHLAGCGHRRALHCLVSVGSESHADPFCSTFVLQQVTITHEKFRQAVLKALLHFRVRPSIVPSSLSSRESVLVKHMQFQVLLVNALLVALRTAVL